MTHYSCERCGHQFKKQVLFELNDYSDSYHITCPECGQGYVVIIKCIMD